jgi:3-oxoacyl-[acyl-carrier-protein] synthase-3
MPGLVESRVGNAMQRYAAVTGWGHHVPHRELSNKDLESLVDTSDEWIESRTGIRARRLAGSDDTTSSLCTRAARSALERARLSARDLELVICATTTPDHLLPATACLVSEKLGAVNAGAVDMNAACSGFLYGLITGAQFIQSGTYNRVLVVAGEVLSRFLNWRDRNTCILLGDGAGAVVLEGTSQRCGILSADLGCRGDSGHILTIPAGGSARPANAGTVAAGAHYVTMRGNEVFKLAVRSMSQAANNALARAGLPITSIHQVIPHQANLRIINATRQVLGIDQEKVFINVDRYGNTGAASVALALSEYLDSGMPEIGANLLLVAFGGGLTWASTVLRWADVAAIIRQRELQGVLPVTPMRAAS